MAVNVTTPMRALLTSRKSMQDALTNLELSFRGLQNPAEVAQTLDRMILELFLE